MATASDPMGAAYEAAADVLVERILQSMREHPEAMNIMDPWDLFKVPGFKCDDIGPSFAQAAWAIGRARRIIADNP